jgi:ribosomal peptide maturation radical SAM protein 1
MTPQPKKSVPSVLLMSLPWTTLTEPSLGLATLHAVLDKKGIPCRVWHLNLFMLTFLRADTYNAISNVFSLNDFLFSGVIDPDLSHRQERWLRQKVKQLLGSKLIDAQLYGGQEGVVTQLLRLRQEVIPDWLSSVAEEVANSEETLIGFTCMFDQTIPSLALAKLIKRQAPEKFIALGGYAVRNPTAEAIVRSFPWIDAVCDGEGDLVIEGLALASVGQLELDEVPGIVSRSSSNGVRRGPSPPPVSLDSLPTPNFNDFFKDVKTLSEVYSVDVEIQHLPLENSRGCWWGAKHHCIFCGIKQEDLSFRSRSAGKVLDAMHTLSQTHGIASFRFSDYILPHQYYKTLLPELAALGKPYRIVSEMKANIDAERFGMLANAGFAEVQPGIESLNSSVLKKMSKGVSAIQNIYTLMLGKRHGIYIHYNLLYGFPDDEEPEYEALVHTLGYLKHLDPPATRVAVQITRYAPLQTEPHKFGIEAANCEPSYELIFSEGYLKDVGFDLDDYCYYFDRTFVNSYRLQRLYEKIDNMVDSWKIERCQREVYLKYARTGDKLKVYDSRNLPEKIIALNEHASKILLLCSDIISLKDLSSQTKLDGEKFQEVLHDLEREGLIFREGDYAVSLVLPG